MGDRTLRIDPLGGFECTVHDLRQRYADPSLIECSPFPHDDRRCPIVVCAGDTVRFGPALFVDGLIMRTVKLNIEDSDETHDCVAVYGYQVGPKRQLADGTWSVRIRPCTDDKMDGEGHFIDERQVLNAVRQATLLPDSFTICDVVRLLDLGGGDIDWYSCDPLIDCLETATEAGE